MNMDVGLLFLTGCVLIGVSRLIYVVGYNRGWNKALDEVKRRN
jgi:hypothetical protein